MESGRDVFGALLSIMQSLGSVEAKQESLHTKIDPMPAMAPDLARLDERPQTVRNIVIAVLVGIFSLGLGDCGGAEYFRAIPAPRAIEEPAPKQ